MRKFKAALLVLSLALCLLTPASAGSNPFDILLSSVQTATGNGGAIYVGGITTLTVYAQCTANNGTPTLDLYLQTSYDGATNWTDLPFELSQKTAATTGEGAVLTNKRDFIDADAAACSPTTLYVAKYSSFGRYIRAAWVMSGVTSKTFAVQGVGK